MREIKFRAWDTDEMYKWEELQEHIKNSGLKFSECIEEYKINLMQYTGLKDKNGVEIYEGDILFLEKWNDHIPERFNIPLDETRKIVFKDGSFCLQELNGDGYCEMHYSNTEYIEVIGNIYENKELLDVNI